TARIAAIGDVDELNSTLGLLLAEEVTAAIRDVLTAIQHDLFDLGGELSIPGHKGGTDAHVERLERAVEAFNSELSPLKEFVLPGGTRAAALAHVARTVCARAARAAPRAARGGAPHPLPARRAPARSPRRCLTGQRPRPPLSQPAFGYAFR